MLDTDKKSLLDFMKDPEDSWDFLEETSKVLRGKSLNGVFVEQTDPSTGSVSLWFTKEPNPYKVTAVYTRIT